MPRGEEEDEERAIALAGRRRMSERGERRATIEIGEAIASQVAKRPEMLQAPPTSDEVICGYVPAQRHSLHVVLQHQLVVAAHVLGPRGLRLGEGERAREGRRKGEGKVEGMERGKEGWPSAHHTTRFLQYARLQVHLLEEGANDTASLSCSELTQETNGTVLTCGHRSASLYQFHSSTTFAYNIPLPFQYLVYISLPFQNI